MKRLVVKEKLLRSIKNKTKFIEAVQLSRIISANLTIFTISLLSAIYLFSIT